MTDLDLAAFAIGIGTGTAVAAVLLRVLIARYVVPCGKAACPHYPVKGARP